MVKTATGAGHSWRDWPAVHGTAFQYERRSRTSAAISQQEAERLLASCMLVDVTDRLLRAAAGLASAEVRTLDTIHLASALRVEADELVAYDRRLIAAAAEHGLAVSSPAEA